MTKKRLLDRVKAAVAARPRRPANWFERLKPSEQEELLATKRAWQQGEFASSASALARDIVAQCQADGVETCSHQWMREWLSRD